MNLAHLMRQTISVAPVASRNSSGDPVLGTKRTQLARVQPKVTLVKGPGGQEAQSDFVIYTATAIGLTDRIWLPGVSSADNTLARVPLQVTTEVELGGTTNYYKVLV